MAEGPSSRARGKRPRQDDAPAEAAAPPPPPVRVIRYTAPVAFPQPGDQVPPPHLREREHHTLLQFEPGTLEHDQAHPILTLPTMQHRSYDRAVIEQLGRGDEFDEMVTARWGRLLRCEWAQFDELTVEFLSTIRYESRPFDSPYAVSFALGGSTYTMSVADFALRMGIYTPEEIASEDFTESLRGVSSTARVGYVTNAELVPFWQTIAVPPHSERRLESQIRDPMLRYLHRILACSLIARHAGREKVSHFDLFCLYCLHGRHPANLATILLASLSRARRGGRTAHLDMGPYVGRMAQALRVYRIFPRRLLTQGPDTTPYTIHDMQVSGMVPFDPPPRWVPHLEDPVLPDPPPMVPPPSTHRMLHRGERPAREEPAHQQTRPRLTVRYLYHRIEVMDEMIRRLCAHHQVEVPPRVPEPRLPSDDDEATESDSD